MPRPIVFLTDYGLEDEFVGVCHAVMARIAPDAPVIDLTHAIPPQDVLRGALSLLRAAPYLPADAVVVAVVDPGVGTERRPIAVETRGGRPMVVPDNGLGSLVWAAEGGVARAVEIRSPRVVLTPLSATFHGRDVFAPAAAHLAAGTALEELGPALDPSTLVELARPEAAVEEGRVATEVLGVDRFGNVQLSASPADLRAAGLDAAGRVSVEARGGTWTAARAETFAEVLEGALGLIEDSSGRLAVVVNRGSAAESLGLVAGDPVELGRPAG
jgi:S-adenosylmethionine hydrolase